MNYRHIYHAGNFADVFKHLVLILIIESLLNKDKPFCYIDTHAGIGKYDLRSREALKTKEFAEGIAILMALKETMPVVVEDYLNAVRENNPTSKLEYYPGSPRLVRSLLRPQDKMILTELHPVDVQILKKEFQYDKQVAVHLLDGYQALKAFLPPTPKRGLVLIDPPYEDPKEFQRLLQNLKMALQRWSNGIYMIWYPIKSKAHVHPFEHQLKRSGFKDILMTEFNLYPHDSPLALNGSGLAIINPPWQLHKKISELLPWLLSKLDRQKQGSYRVEKI